MINVAAMSMDPLPGPTAHQGPTLLELNDLLIKSGIEPEDVRVVRERPTSPPLANALPWFASEAPDIYRTYAGVFMPQAARSILRAKYVVSCIGHRGGQAMFVCLYRILQHVIMPSSAFDTLPGMEELLRLGMAQPEGETFEFFDLELSPALSSYRGKLTIGWPGSERSYYRKGDTNCFPLLSLSETSYLAPPMPHWTELSVSWAELQVLPRDWRDKLSQWRGIYLIFDRSSGKAYIGSASGANNILGRWGSYARTGHGGNALLKGIDPKNLSYSILERLSPDLDPLLVVQAENSWKNRLHTRQPFGLNAN